MELHSSIVRGRWLSVALCAALSLTACGGDEEEAPAATATGAPTQPSSAPPPSGITPPPSGSSGNRAPTISGTPYASTLIGRQYSFRPVASDADGNTLTFSVTGLPAWASFSTVSGRLRGTPTQAQVGTYANIRISVTDGTATAVLPAFSIQVVATATGSALLSWTPPTQNTNGTPLADLAAYRVYFGTESRSFVNSVTYTNAGLTSIVVDQLTPARWYFFVTAINASGVESPLSNVATKTVL